MSRVSTLANEVNTAGIKLSVPAAVIGAQVTGWGPQEWVYALTAFYLILQSLYLLWKWWREANKPDDDADE
jgi:uncharacterized membrane protein YfcA